MHCGFKIRYSLSSQLLTEMFVDIMAAVRSYKQNDRLQKTTKRGARTGGITERKSFRNVSEKTANGPQMNCRSRKQVSV